jgi:hypothetical protein
MNGNIGGMNFPSLKVKESEKNDTYHKKFVEAIINNSINSSYSLDYAAIEQCQNFYNGTQSGDEFNFLQEAEDGEALPAKWINFNKIRTKINLLVGELIKKGYRIDTETINVEAKERKLEKRITSKAETKLRPYMENLEGLSGLPLTNGNLDVNSEEEVDDYYDSDYKEMPEQVMRFALEKVTNSCRWDSTRVALFRDILITGRCATKCEIRNGLPRVERIDPKFVVWDRLSSDDFLTDSSYFGIVRYMPIGEAADKYDLTKEELDKIKSGTENPNLSMTHRRLRENINGTNVSFLKGENDSLRVLVFEGYWVDSVPYTNVISVDKYGNEHVKTIHKETGKEENVISKNYKVWRRGTLVAGEILKDWGIVKNMPRSVDDPAETGCPIKLVIPNYVNNEVVSIVSQLTGLQDLKNITLYNIQMAMSRAGAKGFIYDVSQTPDDWDVHTVIRYLKTAGIAFINSKQDGLPSQFNQFQTFDLTISQSVEQYINISSMVDREMDAISGINEARQGVVPNATQAVGVTQSALLQSNLQTESLFHMYRIYCSELYTYLAGLVKLSWPNQEKYRTIVGDVGFDFLKDPDFDLELDDFGVRLVELPSSVNDKTNVQAIVNVALSSGGIDLIDALMVLKQTDVDKSIRLLKRSMDKKKKEAQEMQAQQIQAQQQAQQQSEQSEMQKEFGLLDKQGQIEKDNIAEKGKYDLAKTATKSKIDFLKEKERIMKQQG